MISFKEDTPTKRRANKKVCTSFESAFSFQSIPSVVVAMKIHETHGIPIWVPTAKCQANGQRPGIRLVSHEVGRSVTLQNTCHWDPLPLWGTGGEEAADGPWDAFWPYGAISFFLVGGGWKATWMIGNIMDFWHGNFVTENF